MVMNCKKGRNEKGGVILVRLSVAVRRHHDAGNSYKGNINWACLTGSEV